MPGWRRPTRRSFCAHLSAYGRSGSRAHWPGYDYLMQAEAGYLSLTGERDGPPARMGLSIVDLMTGLFAAFALVSGVLAARESGKGRDLDVSLFDTAVQNLAYLATWYLNSGHVQGREPGSAHPSLVPSQLYRTRDGFIFIMCNKEKFWPVLCERLGRPEWADDPRFRSFKDRLANRDEVNRLLDEALLARTTAEWLAHFAGRVPRRRSTICKPRWKTRFVAARGLIQDYDHVRMVAGPVRDSASEPPFACRAGARRGYASGAARLRLLGSGDRRVARAEGDLSTVDGPPASRRHAGRRPAVLWNLPPPFVYYGVKSVGRVRGGEHEGGFHHCRRRLGRLCAGQSAECGPAARVLLLEAGPPDRNPLIHIPAGYIKLLDHPVLTWGYKAEPDPGVAGRAILYPRGRVLGGSSSINGMVYVRGQPEDFDHWAQLGNRGWGWTACCPISSGRRVGKAAPTSSMAPTGRC